MDSFVTTATLDVNNSSKFQELSVVSENTMANSSDDALPEAPADAESTSSGPMTYCVVA